MAGEVVRRPIDPTENVAALVEASAATSEKLRIAHERLNEAQIGFLTKMAELRAEQAKLLRESDIDRLEKTRAEDVTSAANAASQLATAVSTLAATADRNAENLRNQLTATALTMAKQTTDTATATASQTDSLVRGINERLSSVEKAINQGAGRQSVADPQMGEFMKDVKELFRVQAINLGGSREKKDFTAQTFALGMFLVAVGSLIVLILRN